MKKRMLSIVLALALCLTFIPTALATGSKTFSGGTGTADDPYLISTAEDMFALAEAVNKDSEDYEGSYFRLTKDIDLETDADNPWTPIGNNPRTKSPQFLGSFDGDHNTVCGLYVDVQEYGYVGLFGAVGQLDRSSTAEVKNLRVEGTVRAARTISSFFAGGIAGLVGQGAKITDCSFQGTVEASATENASPAYAGGIAGYNFGTISGCSVSSSKISGVSSSSASSTTINKVYAAGMAAATGASAIIENCTVENTAITSQASVVGTHCYAGGIVADSLCSITQCTVTGGTVSGIITGTVPEDDDGPKPIKVSGVGGIAGISSGAVTDCVNSASVSGTHHDQEEDNVAQGSGGIVGCNENLVARCVNSGSVTGTGNYIGGVAGYNNTTAGIYHSYNTGDVTGGDYIGGIVGKAEYGTCDHSYNYGAVVSNSSGQAANIGGVFGHIVAWTASAHDCYYLDSSAASSGTADSSATVSNVESKTSDQFASGEVTFLLDDGSTQQIWGQEIGTDGYPLLTDDANKSVIQATFTDLQGSEEYRYANPGGTVEVPEITGTAPAGQTYCWVDADGNKFTDATTISADVTLKPALAYEAPAAGSGYTIDYEAETAAAAEGYKISTDGQTWFDYADAPIEVVPSGTLLVVRVTDGDIYASETTENTLPPRPAAPDAVTGGSWQISGLNASMEYLAPEETVWVKITENMLINDILPNLAPGMYQVRYSAVTTGDSPAFAGEIISVEVTQSFYSGPITYPPTVTEGESGDVSVTPALPKQGDTVTVTPEPEEGFEVGEITVTDQNGNQVEVTENADGTWSFTQPAGQVTISVTFVCDGQTEHCPAHAFADVDTGAWYHLAVDYAIEKGLMNGVGDNLFDPQGTATRAQIVTILWRLEGEPVVNYLMDFEDVQEGSWYAEAVRWAASQGIVDGYDNGAFGPADPVTREQLAAILYRYAQYKGYDVSIGEDTNILSYADAMEISEYAVPAMQWACGAGIVNGMDGNTLVPQGEAARAQIAAMLMRFEEGRR